MANNQPDRLQVAQSQPFSTAWFNRGEFYWRSGASFAWLLLICPVAVFIYSCLVLVDFYHPLTWIAGCIHCVFDDNVWLYMVIFMWHLLPVMLGHFKAYSVKSVVPTTRLQHWLSPLVPPNFFYIPLCGYCGSMSMWCCVSLLSGPYTYLSFPCHTEPNDLCLNEQHFFLVLLGGWIGITYGFNYFWSKQYLLEFPLIKQDRFFRVKASLPGCIYKAIYLSVRNCFWFYVLYFMVGHCVRQLILDTGELAFDSSQTSLTTLSGLIDLYLLWIALTSSVLILSLWFLSNQLFNIFNTQTFRFHMETSFSRDKDKLLVSSLQIKESPLLQYLAFLDLCQLSLYSPRRRKQIFCLSQPGGRPVTWSIVCTQCLKVLNNVKEELLKHVSVSEIQLKKIKNGSVYKVEDKPQQTNSLLNHFNTYSFPVSSTHATPEAHLTRTNPRLTQNITPGSVLTRRGVTPVMSTPGRAFETTSSPVFSPTDETASRSYLDVALESKAMKERELINQNDDNRSRIEKMKDQMIKTLREKTVLSYLIGECPEASAQNIFQDLPMQMWAAEGLSRLVTASFTEDSFGVVQKDLAQILTSMLDLFLALDKYMKLSLRNTKFSIYSQPVYTLPRKTKDYLLRECVKSALYRITNTFRNHLGAVHLEPEVKMKLLSFTEYKE